MKKVLGEEGSLDLITKGEEWLKVSRIIFVLTMRAIRPREEGEPPDVVPRNILEVISSLKFARELQDRVKAAQPPEELPRLAEEQMDAIYKILLGDRAYDADEERRLRAEEFRNRQTRTSEE